MSFCLILFILSYIIKCNKFLEQILALASSIFYLSAEIQDKVELAEEMTADLDDGTAVFESHKLRPIDDIAKDRFGGKTVSRLNKNELIQFLDGFYAISKILLSFFQDICEKNDGKLLL